MVLRENAVTQYADKHVQIAGILKPVSEPGYFVAS
jgi:hypothetical protein